MNDLSCDHQDFSKDKGIQKNASKALVVIFITAIMMVAEIYYGFVTGSMALLADGWHMATHTAAIGVTYLAYKLAMNPNMAKNFIFGGGKLLPLGGFASSIFLFLVAIYVAAESMDRFLKPVPIEFQEALIVATLGLIINFICAYILKDKPSNEQHLGHSHSHSGDHNIRGAYLHVIADALTSIAAIAALLAGQLWGLNWLDPVIGIASSLLILHWSWGLLRDTGWELLDGHAKGINYDQLRARLSTTGSEICDLHVWKIGPQALACELIVKSKNPKGIEFYRNLLKDEYSISHAVIEEHTL
jgi:cation diffusion facilitator family transporter